MALEDESERLYRNVRLIKSQNSDRLNWKAAEA
jgi:hypothetical protein